MSCRTIVRHPITYGYKKTISHLDTILFQNQSMRRGNCFMGFSYAEPKGFSSLRSVGMTLCCPIERS